MNTQNRQILINLPPEMFDDVTFLANQTGKTKTQFVRKSLQRNILFVRRYELPYVNNADEQYASSLLAGWSSVNSNEVSA